MWGFKLNTIIADMKVAIKENTEITEAVEEETDELHHENDGAAAVCVSGGDVSRGRGLGGGEWNGICTVTIIISSNTKHKNTKTTRYGGVRYSHPMIVTRQ